MNSLVFSVVVPRVKVTRLVVAIVKPAVLYEPQSMGCLWGLTSDLLQVRTWWSRFLRFLREQVVMIRGAMKGLLGRSVILRLRLPTFSRMRARLHRARLMIIPAPLSNVSVVFYI